MIADDDAVRAARSEYLRRLAGWADTNRAFLNIIYQAFVIADDWPNVSSVQRKREAEGFDDLDLIDISFQIPHPLGHRDPSSDKVVLTIRGIAVCDSTAEVLENFARTVRLSYRIWTQTADRPEGAILTHRAVEAELGLSGSELNALDRILRRTYLPFGGLSTYADGHWEVSIHDTIRKFKNISSVDDYLKTEADLVLDRFSLARAGFGSPIQHTSSTASVAPERDNSPAHWDVFISHATEDKLTVADRLAAALRAAGLKVWYDRFELQVGDSLRQKIDEGLAGSRYGIVILSHNFFAKHWPQSELDSLVSREANGQKVILPVWFAIGQTEVASYSPLLAGRLAARWDEGAETVVAQLIAAMK